jgi:hypothetical protein
VNIELRRITSNARLSRETNAFAADVWIDGELAATAHNDGGGGQTFMHFHSPELEAAAEQWARSLPPEPSQFGPVPMNLPFYIDLLLEKHLREKHELAQYRRWCKKETVFRLKDDKPGEWRTIRAPFTLNIAAQLRKKHGVALAEILNERLLARETAAA